MLVVGKGKVWSGMVKVFILGLDGLEYNLVHKWNLSNLLQEQNGKTKVPINKKVGEPISPQVWGSFLTGHVVDKEFDKTGFRGPVAKILRFLRGYIPLSLGLGEKVGATTEFPELAETTFLDITDSKEINVPYYSFNNDIFKLLAKGRRENMTLTQKIRILKELYVKNKNQIALAVSEGLPQCLTFAFMSFPDAICHQAWLRPKFIRQFYHDLDYFVYKLKNELNEDVLFLIISDHGFNIKKGSHSHHGFYSSNQPITPEPKRITDFFQLILSWCGQQIQ